MRGYGGFLPNRNEIEKATQEKRYVAARRGNSINVSGCCFHATSIEQECLYNRLGVSHPRTWAGRGTWLRGISVADSASTHHRSHHPSSISVELSLQVPHPLVIFYSWLTVNALQPEPPKRPLIARQVLPSLAWIHVFFFCDFKFNLFPPVLGMPTLYGSLLLALFGCEHGFICDGIM